MRPAATLIPKIFCQHANPKQKRGRGGVKTYGAAADDEHRLIADLPGEDEGAAALDLGEFLVVGHQDGWMLVLDIGSDFRWMLSRPSTHPRVAHHSPFEVSMIKSQNVITQIPTLVIAFLRVISIATLRHFPAPIA
jgi:hypothetical protein